MFFSHIAWTNIEQFDYKLKKCRWHAWESNPGQQDGRHRQIHWAMAAPIIFLLHPSLVSCRISESYYFLQFLIFDSTFEFSLHLAFLFIRIFAYNWVPYFSYYYFFLFSFSTYFASQQTPFDSFLHIPGKLPVWPDWAIYWTLGTFIKALGKN